MKMEKQYKIKSFFGQITPKAEGHFCTGVELDSRGDQP